jgi:hypothetical protein
MNASLAKPDSAVFMRVVGLDCFRSSPLGFLHSDKNRSSYALSVARFVIHDVDSMP